MFEEVAIPQHLVAAITSEVLFWYENESPAADMVVVEKIIRLPDNRYRVDSRLTINTGKSKKTSLSRMMFRCNTYQGRFCIQSSTVDFPRFL